MECAPSYIFIKDARKLRIKQAGATKGKTMCLCPIQKLIVSDQNGHLTGIVTTTDLLVNFEADTNFDDVDMLVEARPEDMIVLVSDKTLQCFGLESQEIVLP